MIKLEKVIKMDSFNEEFKKMIVQMYLDGESVSDLSRKYEVSRPSVYNWIRQFKPIQLEDGKTTDVSDIIKLKQEMIKLKEEAEKASECKSIFLESMSDRIKEPMGSIIESAKMNKLNIYKYINYLFKELPQLEGEQKESDIEK